MNGRMAKKFRKCVYGSDATGDDYRDKKKRTEDGDSLRSLYQLAKSVYKKERLSNERHN
jgi:hypothetical protein